jgi:hypothetical protein
VLDHGWDFVDCLLDDFGVGDANAGSAQIESPTRTVREKSLVKARELNIRNVEAVRSNPTTSFKTQFNGLKVDSPRDLIWSDVTRRDQIHKKSPKCLYVAMRSAHGSRPESAEQARVRLWIRGLDERRDSCTILGMICDLVSR